MNKDITHKVNSELTLHLFLGLLFCTIGYLYYPFIQDYSTTPKWIAMTFLAGIAFFFGIKRSVPFSWPLIFWLMFACQYLVQCFRSINIWEAILHGLPLIIAPLIIVLLLKYNPQRDHLIQNIGFWLSLVLFPLVLWSLGELLVLMVDGQYNHQSTYNFRFTFGHRNQFVQFLTLSFPVIFIGLRSETKRWLKGYFVSFIVLASVVVLLLMNRTSTIVLFGIYPLFFVIYRLSKLNRKLRLYVTLLFLGSVFVLAILAIFKPDLIPGANYLFETNFGSGNERIRIWKHTFSLIQEAPLLGYGSGDWKIEILRFPLAFTQAEDGMIFYQRAHNDFLQIMAENGILGLLLLLFFFITGVAALWKSKISEWQKMTLIAGIFGFIIMANLSFPFEKIELLLIVFVFMIPTFSKSRAEHGSTLKKGILNGGIFILIALTLCLSVYKLQQEKIYASFKATHNIDDLTQLNTTFYTIDPISTPVKWHFGNHFFEYEQFSEAIHYYQSALKSNPYHIHVINNLASTYVKMSQPDSAKKYYGKVLKLNPTFTETRMNMASLEFNSGNIDGALGHILKVKLDTEPETYMTYIAAIGQAKCRWLVDLYDEPKFEKFLIDNDKNATLFYDISVKSRTTGASFEDELRLYFKNSK